MAADAKQPCDVSMEWTYHNITRPSVQWHVDLFYRSKVRKEILNVILGSFFMESSDKDIPSFDSYYNQQNKVSE